jgi:hypothetical protein
MSVPARRSAWLNVWLATAIRRCARCTPRRVGLAMAFVKRATSSCQATNTSTNALCSAVTFAGGLIARSAAIVSAIAAEKRASVRRSWRGVLVGVASASIRSAFVW